VIPLTGLLTTNVDDPDGAGPDGRPRHLRAGLPSNYRPSVRREAVAVLDYIGECSDVIAILYAAASADGKALGTAESPVKVASDFPETYGRASRYRSGRIWPDASLTTSRIRSPPTDFVVPDGADPNP